MTWDTIAVYLLLCLSGNTMWSLGNDVKHIYLLAFSLSFFFCLRKGIDRFKQAITYIIFWVLLFCIQAPVCPYFNASSTLFYIIKISIAAFIICAVGKRFCETYFKVIYILSIISLVFFTFNAFGVWFTPLVQAYDRNSIFIHTQLVGSHGQSILRNSGMFWEPGAFQGYIILALLPYIAKLDELYHKKRKEMLIIAITLFTTYSTTAIFASFFVYILYLLLTKKMNLRMCVSFTAAFTIFSYILFCVSAVSDKLGITGTSTDILGGSRILPATILFPKILEYPIFGHGFSNEAIVAANMKMCSGNGFIALLYFGGLLFTLAYFIVTYKCLSNSSNTRIALSFIIVIIVLLQGEGFLGYPLFWGIALFSSSLKEIYGFQRRQIL